MAEREGFEPPIGLHLCRISSAVHSTTLPPLQAPKRAACRPAVGASSRRGRRARQGAGSQNSSLPVRRKGNDHHGALDRQGQWRRVPCRAHRNRAAVAAAAWLARILAHLGAGDGAACRSLHLARAGPARLRRQRQAHWAVRSRTACRRYAGAARCARPPPGRPRRP